MFDEPIVVAFYCGGLGVVLELWATLYQGKQLRQMLYAISLLLTAFAVVLVLAWYMSVPALLVGLVATYRVFNGLRVLYDRMQAHRSFQVTRRTSWWLTGYQVVSILFLLLGERLQASSKAWLFSLLLLALLPILIMLHALRRNLKKTAIRPSDRYIPDMDLPTVSVCIPARNETEDLQACLESVLASDYPKLEVIVLDDCSYHITSEIIKGLARGGVRFIHGLPPKKGWLAKNQAYDTLAEHTSGTLVLFLGADVRLEKRAISTLVASMASRKKQMISVLPMGLQKQQDSGLIQPMRYWWELALPRRFFNRPPALSTAWMIRRDVLKKLGGFRAVSNTVVPESYFARELSHNDSYSFMRAGGKLKLYSNKTLDEQWETALRLRYPQLRHRPETVLLLTIAELVVLVLPISLFCYGFFVPLGLLWVLAGIATILLGVIHFWIIRAWQVPDVMQTTATLPFAIVLELIILQVSMHKYEFGNVVWKDRNICIPVMKVTARLPKA